MILRCDISIGNTVEVITPTLALQIQKQQDRAHEDGRAPLSLFGKGLPYLMVVVVPPTQTQTKIILHTSVNGHLVPSMG